MPTQVIVYDSVAERSWDLLFTDDSMVTIANNWCMEDRMLTELKDTPFFDGATRWDQLKPVHFKTVIARTFVHLDGLSEAELQNPQNATSVSMSFLIGCLLRCVNQRSQLDVDLLKIRRVSVHQIHYDFSCALNADHTKPEAPPSETKGFKVVVDNTRG